MKTQVLFSWIVLLFITPSIAFAANNGNWKGKHTKEKTIKKEFKVSKDALIKINNSYGNIILVTNSGSTASFDILIKTNSNDAEKAQKKLDDISVEFNATNSQVSAKTLFNNKKSDSWWSWGNKDNKVNMEITYRVSIPMSNNIDFNNDYGSITLDKLEGKATISCDYGKITTKELMADNNLITFDYTKNSYFEYIKGGTISADYSEFTVAKAKNLELSADYTTSSIQNIENIRYQCDYGSLHVDNLNNIQGSGDYLSFSLGNVRGNVDLKQDYGSIRINNMTETAGNVNIVSDYAGIDIGYDPGYHFSFDLELSYGSLRNASDLNIIKKTEKSSNKSYFGNNHGKGA